MTDLVARIRQEIGDPLQPFKTTSLGDGMTTLYDLPKQNIQEPLQVSVINGASITYPTYTLNDELGYVLMDQPVPNGATLLIEGNAWGMFTDNDLITYLQDSANQHFAGRNIEERFWTRQGFIGYRESPMDITNMPDLEAPLLVMLATINVLWVLANDAATDADIQTAEGTNINRTGRYRQLMGHIADLQERYEKWCAQLNVGVFRTETLKLRRISKTTGRLVPLFKSREYDDHRWPTRQLPPIDGPWTDDSGIPSPLWNASGY